MAEYNAGPINTELLRAIDDLTKNASDANRSVLYQQLLDSTVLLAVTSLPASIPKEQWAIADEDAPLQPLTSTNAEGKDVLLVFPDLRRLNERVPGCPWVAINGRDVLRLVVDNDLGGIVLNPTGPWLEISADEIKALV